MKTSEEQNNDEKMRFKGHATPIHQPFHERAAVLLFSEAVAGNRCSRDQYKKGDDCLSCASCPPGQQITLNCGHDNKGVTTGEKCKSCNLGSTFSDRNSTDRCTNCLRTYESEGGNCVAQKITPKPTIQPKKTTITVTSRRTKTTLPITSTIQPKKTTITVTSRRTKTTLPITSKVSTTKPSSPLNNTKKNESHLTTPWRSSRNPLKATDNATPIPPTEEAMLLSLRSHSTTETSLRSLDKLAFTSLSAETIVNGGQDRLSSSSCGSALRSENDGVLSHSCSNCRAPSPLCGRSTDHNCMTSLAPSTCVTRSLPYTPENSRVTSPANSCCPTGLPSSEHSPEHRCVTPSSWSTRMSHDSSSSSGVSPDPSNFSSFQSHSNFGEDHEVYSQSGEYTPSSQMQSIPISVEAVDHAGPSKAMAKNSHLTPKKATKAKSVKERENLSTKGDVTSHRDCESQLTESSARKESRNDKEKKMTQKPADEDLSDSVAMSSNGNATRIRAEKIKTAVPQTNKYVTPRSHCKYRPIQRHEEHRCSECCPQPEDSFFQLINKERLCLKEQICKELSRSYKDLAISARVENKTAEWETSSNPAELVLDTIKASHPKMKLKEFDELLLQMKRLDIVELIQNHHLSCSLCQRNRFDSRA
ncbi:hypothetical protein P5673_029818 [Acropora cervicornis]|uniref:Uncharacterized protein n=1 Tax=Acropora cervicornis TaxID=6130 RepID=A0AAD9UTU4_ACRCE|nr:hypothetical protein P5673_029818 [Acropora cervicornis]